MEAIFIIYLFIFIIRIHLPCSFNHILHVQLYNNNNVIHCLQAMQCTCSFTFIFSFHLFSFFLYVDFFISCSNYNILELYIYKDACVHFISIVFIIGNILSPTHRSMSHIMSPTYHIIFTRHSVLQENVTGAEFNLVIAELRQITRGLSSTTQRSGSLQLQCETQTSLV